MTAIGSEQFSPRQILMKKWQDIVDQLVKSVIGDGDISHLPGAGRPLQLQDESHTPAELRAAHKIMNDNKLLPDWVAAGHALDQMEENLRLQIRKRAARYAKDKSAAQSVAVLKSLVEIEEDWKRYKLEFSDRIGRYNREALIYNLKVPSGIAHKQILNSSDLIERALHTLSE